jgi:two-component system phosphate regulon response regulator PhoB
MSQSLPWAVSQPLFDFVDSPRTPRRATGSAPAGTVSPPWLASGPGRLREFLLPPDNHVPEDASQAHAAGKVLVLLSDGQVGAVLAYCLAASGFAAHATESWLDGLAFARQFVPDVVLIDSRAPDFLSTQVWRRLRADEPSGRRCEVLVLIRNEEDIDPSIGIDMGPCNFVLYPLSVRALVLRIDGMVRSRPVVPVDVGAARHGPGGQGRRYVVGPLDLDMEGYVVLVNGKSVHLSALEMRLLCYLVENHGSLRTRKDLLKDVWGYRATVSTRSPDIYVNRLRTKLGPAAVLIETVRGAGYRLSSSHPVQVKDREP